MQILHEKNNEMIREKKKKLTDNPSRGLPATKTRRVLLEARRKQRQSNQRWKASQVKAKFYGSKSS